MNESHRQSGGPEGGLQFHADAVRRWRWSPKGELLSAPVRCKREQWYLARGLPANGVAESSADLLLSFLHGGETVSQQCISLDAITDGEHGRGLLGWVQVPERATHLQVCLPEASRARRFDRLILHPVAERDPKCHPVANVPRWSQYRPPFPIERVVVPQSMAVLADRLGGLKVEPIARPQSVRALAAKAIGAACIVDETWVRGLRLELSDLERIAAGSWMILDLGTYAELLNRSTRKTQKRETAGGVQVKTHTYTAEPDIMSARVEYADVATRGFALQDVIPYSTLVGEAGFRTRVLLAGQAWKRHARETGFATLLASETPWENKCGDVLSAARPFDHGELIATDLPWLVAGREGSLLAPRLAEHLLRMHLGVPLADSVQYWNRWDECAVLLRDIADLSRHYPPLHAVRWASQERNVAQLGITLPAGAGTRADRHLMVRTGRIDQRSSHDGLPPEPMIIFVKWLAREVREGTRWARRFLANTALTWQFDTTEGLKYVAHYESAASVGAAEPTDTMVLVTKGRAPRREPVRSGRAAITVREMPDGVGIFGDRSLAYQAELTSLLRRWIEKVSA